MKRNILLLLIFICCWSVKTSLYAQEEIPSTIDLLQSKEWIMWFPSKKEYTSGVRFSADTWTSVFSFRGRVIEQKQSFYLSNNFELSEKLEKQRDLENGKYIKRNDQGKIIVFEILKLTQDSLILKNLNNSSILTYFSKDEK